MISAAERHDPHTGPATGPTTPPTTPPTAGPSHMHPGGGLDHWMSQQRNAMATPAQITAVLISNGWNADAAARASLRSLRSSDRHTLTYAALNIASGLAALGAATSLHQILDGNNTPESLTWMLTMTVIATPIALMCGYYAGRAERRSRFVLWSPSRRGWFGALATCTATVGIVRLIAYVYDTLSTLTGASSEPFSWTAALQVLISVAISLPLFVWSFLQWRRSDLMISTLGTDR